MKYNSIGYADVQLERKRTIVEQPGYKGKHYYAVYYDEKCVALHCADETAALFYAAKHWNIPFKRPEYHQTAKAVKLGCKPRGMVGERI